MGMWLALLLVGSLALGPAAGEGGQGDEERRRRHPQVDSRLEDGPGYRVRNPVRAWGTAKTVRLLSEVLPVVARELPGTHDLRVGDLSWRGGGKIRPHRSHRKGLDADVSYFTLGDRPDYWLIQTTTRDLDLARTWRLVKALLATRQVQFIFMDYTLQRALWQHAVTEGYSAAQLADAFQYPDTRYTRRGIIRWVRGHDTHFHVRFVDGPDTLVDRYIRGNALWSWVLELDPKAPLVAATPAPAAPSEPAESAATP